MDVWALVLAPLGPPALHARQRMPRPPPHALDLPPLEPACPALRLHSVGKPCITDTAEECQKCLNARLSMVDKKLRPGVWGDPPSFRQTVNPVPMEAASAFAGSSGGSTSGSSGSGSSRGYATRAAGLPAALMPPVAGMPLRGSRGLATSGAGVQQAAPAHAAALGVTPGGPAKGSDVPRTNIGIFGCMNAGKSSLMNRITRR